MILRFSCFHKASAVKIDVAVYYTGDTWLLLCERRRRRRRRKF
jgi:hypothetical protein